MCYVKFCFKSGIELACGYAIELVCGSAIELVSGCASMLKRVSSTTSQLQECIDLFKSSLNRKKKESTPPKSKRKKKSVSSREKPVKSSIEEAMIVLNDIKDTISIDGYLAGRACLVDETTWRLFMCYYDDVRRESLRRLVRP
ncbi:hypothetical protein CDL15_Pgr004755 [Punica granatum]|uniref:Uncharacterized protein n=1 Tax=Punica granatum TaxID=22663 RepID=A0A218W6V7_PUNGR|nr:hypothetical protein CDL15_Pgr004755 [Punica granatum]